jgi:hypothetical protein
MNRQRVGTVILLLANHLLRSYAMSRASCDGVMALCRSHAKRLTHPRRLRFDTPDDTDTFRECSLDLR